MRYGKVYFYDRMGNREPTDSDRVKEALDNFDAPRFRPPAEAKLTKHYTTQFSPLETPPPFEQESNGFGMAVGNTLRSPDSDDLGFPPRAPALIATPPFRDVGKFRMEDIPDDPRSRIEPPFSTNPIGNADLPEEIGASIDQGIMKGVNSRLADEMDVLSLKERIGGAEEKFSFDYDRGFHENGEICAQCRLEEMHLNRMRAEADAEVEKHREAARKAAMYEEEISRKEREALMESDERKRRLMNHVDRVNEELVQEHRLRRKKSPPTDYYIFRREDEDVLEKERRRKDDYGRELGRQMEERRLRLVAEHERDEALAAASNSRAAKEFAAARDADEQREEHSKEALRKQLEFQMQRRAPPDDTKWLWWAERPDEHGWRAARIAGQGNQVERNEHMRGNIQRLEDFKRRQAEGDAEASQRRRAKYAEIRERLHENSELVHGKPREKVEKGLIWKANAAVEAAWKEAHERNEKKYRILQESTAKSISGAAAGSLGHVGCRRCIRCRRPLGAGGYSKGETLYPKNVTFYPLK